MNSKVPLCQNDENKYEIQYQYSKDAKQCAVPYNFTKWKSNYYSPRTSQ